MNRKRFEVKEIEMHGLQSQFKSQLDKFLDCCSLYDLVTGSFSFLGIND
jgi:hypothetical protein